MPFANRPGTHMTRTCRLLGYCLVTLSTICAQWCSTVGPVQTGHSNLGGVRLVGESLSIDNTDERCPGALGPVEDTLQADVVARHHYTILWNITACGQSSPRWSTAFVDWNGTVYLCVCHTCVYVCVCVCVHVWCFVQQAIFSLKRMKCCFLPCLRLGSNNYLERFLCLPGHPLVRLACG